MSKIICPNCKFNEQTGRNSTNHAAVYYCSNCEQPFDPASWPCPRCDDADPVSRNPFDDPKQYYCYECNLAFNRLGPSFEPVTHETLRSVGGDPSKQLVFEASEVTESTPGIHPYDIGLQNTGERPIQTMGHQPIAIQYQVTDDDWWTLYGNPDHHSPADSTTLQPGQRLDWHLLITPHGIEGTFGSVDHRPLPSGTYRVVYWGLAETDAVIASRLSVEFDHGW